MRLIVRTAVALCCALVQIQAQAAPLPYRIDTQKDLLAQTSAVVRGTVTSITFSYDEEQGPRTNVMLAVSDVPFGDYSGMTVAIPLLGGYLPSGNIVLPSELPHFVDGGTYVVFLRNTSWFLAPTLPAVFRVVTVDQKEILVSPDGFALTGADAEEGFQFTAEPVFSATIDLEHLTAAPDIMPTYDISQAIDEATFLGHIGVLIEKLGVEVSGSFSALPTLPPGGWNEVPEADPTPAPLPPAPPPGEPSDTVECVEPTLDDEDLCDG